MESVVDAFVTNMLKGMAEKARQSLVNSGFDRWTLKKWNVQNKNSDFPELLGFSALLENLLFTGVSDFVVHHLYFNSINSKVSFDVSIPKLLFSIGKGEVNFDFFGANSKGTAKGQVLILEVRIVGEAVVNLSDNFDYALRSMELQFTLKAIKSNLNVKINDIDYSSAVNTFLMTTVTEFIKKYEAKINEALIKVVLQNWM